MKKKFFCCSSFWQLTCRFNQVFIAPAQHRNYSSIFQDVQVWLLSMVQVIFLVLHHLWLWFTFIVTFVQLTLSVWGTHVIHSVNILYLFQSNDYLYIFTYVCMLTVHCNDKCFTRQIHALWTWRKLYCCLWIKKRKTVFADVAY